MARSFSFPFAPYAVQTQLMTKIYECLNDGGVGVFESPTGTGKSLSVICSALQWRADAELERRRTLASSGPSPSAPREATDEPDWLRNWEVNEQHKKKTSELAVGNLDLLHLFSWFMRNHPFVARSFPRN